MQSAVRKAGLLVLVTLLFCGCSAQREISPRGNLESGGVADRRPCIANFSVEGNYWSGHAVKSFEDYPNSSKSTAFAHIISKITSIGYVIESSDKEAGLIGASYRVTTGKEVMTSLFASVKQRGQTGVRVDLAFMTGGLATFSVDEVQKEFCAILEGVPQIEKMETVETRIREEPIVGKKPLVSEKPMIVEKPVPSALQTPQPTSLMSLVVKKKANLREKATIKSKTTGKVKKGEKLEILDRSGNWFRVKSASGLTGWIYTTLVRRLK
jgi:hypothetical protein